MAEGIKYVVHGMKAECSEGTMQNYINADVGHGVLYQGQPLLNANDHEPQKNLTHFGDCNSRKIFEEAKKQADEKYKAEEGDGFFASAGKFLAKTAVKSALTAKELFSVRKCELDTPLPWMFCNMEHMIDGAPALTMESQCPCRYGGIIKIVQEEEAAEEAETAETVKMDTPVAMAAAPAASAVSMAGGNAANSLYGGITDELNKIFESAVEKAEKDTYYIRKYVNEESFKRINPMWAENMDTFKELYGEDVFSQLRTGMYRYGITDETSILMFLSTIGTESGYGSRITERYTESYLADKIYCVNTRGAGLIQLTGVTQQNFLKYVRDGLEENDPKAAELDSYINAYHDITKPNGITASDCDKDATGYIAENYGVESALWFWSKNTEKAATFDAEGNQTSMSLNDYIGQFKDGDQDNVFLAVQYAVNGKQGFSKKDLQIICESEVSVIQSQNGKETKQIKIGDKTKNLPNGWDCRKDDWDSAKGLIEGIQQE